MSLLPEQRAFTTLHTVTLATQMLGRTGKRGRVDPGPVGDLLARLERSL